MDNLIAKIEKALPRKKIHIFNDDKLMNSSIPYYIIALLTTSGFADKDHLPSPFVILALVYVGLPLLDEIFSLDLRNPNQKQRKQLQKNDTYFLMALYVALLLDWALFIKILMIMQNFQLSLGTFAQFLGIIFIVTNLEGVQFVVAHQILHKPGKFHQVLGTLHMSKLYYMHFTYHHLYKHHSQVATPNDPTTAKKGENFYDFIVRCVRDSWKGVYQSEAKLKKPFYKNCAVLSIVSSLVIGSLIYLVFGLQPFIVHNCIAFGAIIYLETVSYIQHYGLLRKLLPNGEYEKVTILHSWNAPHRFSNYLLFKLQRHSDHHQNSMKPYQTLNSLDQSPLLPHGYATMVLMAFFPKVWFRVMDPLVEAYGNLQLSDKGEISPQVRVKAEAQTRKFMLSIALIILALLGLSLLKII